MSGATKTDYLEFKKSEFMEEHSDLILDLAGRCGEMAGRGDILALTIFHAHISQVFNQTAQKYREMHDAPQQNTSN